MKTKAIYLLIYLLIFPAISFSEQQKPGFGIGAYPLSSSTVSMWLLKQNDDGNPETVVVVYFSGEDGWHNRPWKSEFQGNIKRAEKTLFELKSDDVTLTLAVSDDGLIVSVQGNDFNLEEGNVFVVRNVDRGSDHQEIVKIGRFDLPYSDRVPVSVALLQTKPEIQAEIH
ncbi:MAG: hypothetical protein LR015_13005 [Verrucomicrobia bacterium]|nr:hypothetical protein [Verrucomicrobiota bacterium]